MLRRMSHWKPRYFDIGVNFSDGMFKGHYNGSISAKHPQDIAQVISRARLFGVEKMLITASSIEESRSHLELVTTYGPGLGSTAGVHPCSIAEEFYGGLDCEVPLQSVPGKLQQLKDIVLDGHSRGLVKAFGEIGLDYDRLHYSSKTQQRSMFLEQLRVYSSLKHLKLPLFLHMRAACSDFVDIIEQFLSNGSIEPGNGVVHSFTGSQEDLRKILELGFYVGVNGCSLKTQENLDVARMIPKERLLIETDAPWCEIRKSHACYNSISPYPNLFYPRKLSPRDSSETAGFSTEAPPQSTKPSAKKNLANTIKLDAFLPFPSIKKENFHKHMATVKKNLENVGEAPSLEVGEFAYPLIKSRNEPVQVGHVAEVMCELYGLQTVQEKRDFLDLVYDNSCKLFHM